MVFMIMSSTIPLSFWINPQLRTQPFQKFTREIMRLSHDLAMGSTVVYHQKIPCLGHIENPLELGHVDPMGFPCSLQLVSLTLNTPPGFGNGSIQVHVM